MYEQKRSEPKHTDPIHPIWRGIGFALIVLAPIMGYAASILILKANEINKWYPVPKDLLVKWQDPYILVKLIITAVIAFLLFMIFQLITFLLYRLFGPSRYGATDVPSVKYRGKKYKR